MQNWLCTLDVHGCSLVMILCALIDDHESGSGLTEGEIAGIVIVVVVFCYLLALMF